MLLSMWRLDSVHRARRAGRDHDGPNVERQTFQHRAADGLRARQIVKGASSEGEVNVGMVAIHTLIADLFSRVQLEQVENKTGWADASPRLMFTGPLVPANQFRLAPGHLPTWPWKANGHSPSVQRSNC